MPSISFFADSRDASVLMDQLNADPEIAFIVPDGPLDPEEALYNRLLASPGGDTAGTSYWPFGVADDGIGSGGRPSGPAGGRAALAAPVQGDRL
jgi:hypothetical protein